MKKWLILVFLGTFLNLQAESLPWIEKSKDIFLNFDASGVLKVNVTNQFGNVRVVHWNRKSIKVNVKIKANATSNSLIDKYLENVKITNEVKDKILFLNTHMSPSVRAGTKDRSKSYCTVDYLIYMPQGTKLQVDNSFGDIFLPEFRAPLVVSLQHGNLQAPLINNVNSQVNIKFSTACIDELVGGCIVSTNSNLNVQVLKNANLQVERGMIRAESLENTKAKLKYAKTIFNNLSEQVELDVYYSTDLKLGNIDKDLKSLLINTTYSDIQLPDFIGVLEVQSKNGQVFFGQGVEFKTFNQKVADSLQKYKHVNAVIGPTQVQPNKVIIKAVNADVKLRN
jgi:hypothetical protein